MVWMLIEWWSNKYTRHVLKCSECYYAKAIATIAIACAHCQLIDDDVMGGRSWSCTGLDWIPPKKMEKRRPDQNDTSEIFNNNNKNKTDYYRITL